MMRTIVITGGTDGIGKQLALQYISSGDRVFVIGRSAEKGKALHMEAVKLGNENFIFLQADLSRISENLRVIREVSEQTSHIDLLILCAQSQKLSKVYRETGEGVEHHFALYYLSRFILSYQFRELLSGSPAPLIINICAPGGSGDVHWDDLQLQAIKPFNSIKAILHGSRLNDLLGVAFAERNTGANIKYVLFNPGAVQTKGATEAFDHKMVQLLVKLLYRIVGKSAEKAVEPVLRLAAYPPDASLTAYKQDKKLVFPKEQLTTATQADQLFAATLELIESKYGELDFYS